MSADTRTGFQVGDAVVVREGRWKPYRYERTTVARIYKNGNLVLAKDTKQQYSPQKWSGDGEWSATATGDSWHRAHAYLLTPKMEAEIAEEMAQADRERRWHKVRERINRVANHAITDAMLDAIEAALPKEAARE